MNIHVCGINYKTAPICEREKLSFNIEEQMRLMNQLLKTGCINECVMLSTCNRTELYFCKYQQSDDLDVIDITSNDFNCCNSTIAEALLCREKSLDYHSFKKYLYLYSGSKAVKHLFKVASGLDSMVIGEDQILKQVKDAHMRAMNTGASASILNTLFRHAVTVAKETKTCTKLSKKSISVASIAVKLLNKFIGENVKEKAVLIIGTGETGFTVLKNLLDTEIGKIYVSGRSHGKIPSCVCSDSRIVVVDYSERYHYIDKTDAIISCTSSPHYTVTSDMIESTLTVSKKRIFIDLAVPRDIDEEIKKIQDCVYYNIDDLKGLAEENRIERHNEAIKAERIIDKYVESFEKWYLFRNTLPLVNEIKNNAYLFVENRIGEMISEIDDIGTNKKLEIMNCFKKAFNSLLNKFLYDAKEAGTIEEIDAYYRCLCKVLSNFKIEDKKEEDIYGKGICGGDRARKY